MPSVDPTLFQFTEKQFRRFEPHFRIFVNTFPTPYIFALPGIAINTLLARTRDAARSFISLKWQSDIDHQKFEHLWLLTKVIKDPTGTKACIIKRNEDPINVAPPSPVNTSNVDNPPEDLFVSICICANHSFFGDTPIHFTNLSERCQSLIATITDKYPNIVFTPTNTPNEYILV